MARVQKLSLTQPDSVQTQIRDILDSDNDSVDFQKLADKLSSQKSWDMEMSEIMDSQKLVSDFKSGNLSQSVLESLAET